MPQPIRKYSDIDATFFAHPITGDVPRLLDGEAAKRQIINVILTDNYARLFQPNLGSGISQLLFENFDPITEFRIKTRIEDSVRQHVPNVILRGVAVNVSNDYSGYNATIVFEVRNLPEPITLGVFLQRVR